MSLTPTDPYSTSRRPMTPTAALREAKLRLANDIENLLDTFTKLTDLSVSEIYVEQVLMHTPHPHSTATSYACA